MRAAYVLCLLAAVACGDDTATPPGEPVGTAPGTLRLVVTVSGSDVDSAYSVSVQDGPGDIARDVRAGTPTDIEVEAGTRAIALSDLTPNCHIAEGLPFAADVTSGAVTDVRLTVLCEAFAYVVVAIRPTDPQLPTDGLELRCQDASCGTEIFRGGTALFRMTAGWHVLELPQPRCTDGTPSPKLPVLAVAGDTVRADFPLVCTVEPGNG